MEVGTNPVAQEWEVTKLVLPKGPSMGLKSWEMREAEIMGRVSPLRFINVSQAVGGGFVVVLPPRRSLFVLYWCWN